MTSLLSQPLAITAVGALTPVGANAEQTTSSIRAGISGMGEFPRYLSLTLDPDWADDDPLVAAPVPTLDPKLACPPRLIELALPVLAEVFEKARLKRADLPRTALRVAGPEPDAAVLEWQLGERFLPALLRESGLTSFQSQRLHLGGSPGAFELLAEVAQLLTSGSVDRCLLLAVDSYLSLDRLELLDRDWRLRSERSPDGFIPGEAACALMLELPARAATRGGSTAALIKAGFVGEEPQPASGDQQSSSRGLCQALEPLLGAAVPALWVGCDLNGASYRAFEWATAAARLGSRLPGATHLTHPADCTGDLGAATGAVLIAQVAAAYSGGWAPAPDTVLWTAAEGPRRAAIRLSAA